MMLFPNIPNPSKINERMADPAIRTEFETGIVHTRPRFTRIRRVWELTWDTLLNNDYQALKDFYFQNLGGGMNFDWTHPLENESYNVRFKDELRADSESAWLWKVTIVLEQV